MFECIQKFHFRFRFFPDFDISMPFNTFLTGRVQFFLRNLKRFYKSTCLEIFEWLITISFQIYVPKPVINKKKLFYEILTYTFFMKFIIVINIFIIVEHKMYTLRFLKSVYFYFTFEVFKKCLFLFHNLIFFERWIYTFFYYWFCCYR